MSKLKKAILNNNDLYQAIFNPQHIESERNNSIWYCLEKTPSLYSNLVTISKDWKPDNIFRQIDANSKKENWDEWSVKDSFSTLDLRKYGFKKLFDAQWIYLEAAKFESTKTSKNLDYKIVETEKDLSDWRIAWDSNEQLGKEVFRAELLDDLKVCFVAGYDKQKIVSGCFINKTADVLGVSNFFASGESIKYWSDLIEFIFSSIKSTDIVGYKRRNLAKELELIGFETIGDLIVWLKN